MRAEMRRGKPGKGNSPDQVPGMILVTISVSEADAVTCFIVPEFCNKTTSPANAYRSATPICFCVRIDGIQSHLLQIPDVGYLQQVGLEGIADLPPGKYTVKTRHEKLKTQKQSVVVPDSGDVAVQLDLNRGVPGVLYK